MAPNTPLAAPRSTPGGRDPGGDATKPGEGTGFPGEGTLQRGPAKTPSFPLPFRSRARGTLRRYLLAGLFCLTVLLLGGSLGRAEATVSPPVDPREGFRFPEPADFSALSWTEAFERAHEKLAREYAFGEWKGVPWRDLRARFLPRIRRGPPGEGPAGHLPCPPGVPLLPPRRAREAENGGSLGAKGPRDGTGRRKLRSGCGGAGGGTDRRCGDPPGGSADRGGIRPGAEILDWGDVPVRRALERVDPAKVPLKTLTGAYGGESPQATEAHRRLERVRLLTRAPVGAAVEAVLRNPGEPHPRIVRLVAEDDGGWSLSRVDFARRAELSDRVERRILPGGFGYVRLGLELDLAAPKHYPRRVFEQFREAIRSFVEADVPGVVVDLRGNYGGRIGSQRTWRGSSWTNPPSTRPRSTTTVEPATSCGSPSTSEASPIRWWTTSPWNPSRPDTRAPWPCW